MVSFFVVFSFDVLFYEGEVCCCKFYVEGYEGFYYWLVCFWSG